MLSKLALPGQKILSNDATNIVLTLQGLEDYMECGNLTFFKYLGGTVYI